MSTRQYIGARYVPLIAGDWDNSNTYDPLTIVMYQGNSYTSRTYVPAGIDISNTTYWALTGNYNAQVEAYRQEVLNYTNTVDNTLSNILAGKVCAFFGDSTTAGFISDSGSPVLSADDSYPTKFGELTHATIHNFAQGGATMSNQAQIQVNQYSFDLQIDKCNTDVGVANVDYAFVDFGINDCEFEVVIGNTDPSIADTYLDESRFVDAFRLGLKKLYTLNSKISVIVIIPDYTTREMVNLANQNNDIGLNLESYRNALINYCGAMGIPTIDFRRCGVNRINYQTYHNGDPFHFTKVGYLNQANYLAKNWRDKIDADKQDRDKKKRMVFPMVGPNFFRSATQNTISNYINGIAFGLIPGNSITSQESVFLQTGEYIISSTTRSFVAADVKVELLDASDDSVLFTNLAHVVSFDEYVWHLNLTSNVTVKVRVTNLSSSEGNLVFGNFDIRPAGDMYAPRRALNTVSWTQLEEHTSIYGASVSLLENKKLHVSFQFYNTDSNNHSGILFETSDVTSIVRNCALIGVDTDDGTLEPVNFYIDDGKLVINCLVKAGHKVSVSGEIFLGDNTTAYDVIC